VLGLVPVKESETAEFLAEIIREVLMTWDIKPEKIIAIISDGAANIKAAITKQLGIEWIYCAAHIINRSVCLALGGELVKPIIKAAKAIAKTFKASPAAKHGMC